MKTAKTNAERQQEYRARRKALGRLEVKITLENEEERQLIERCREEATDPCNTLNEWLRKALMTGVVFRMNSGRARGRKATRDGERYAITEGEER